MSDSTTFTPSAEWSNGWQRGKNYALKNGRYKGVSLHGNSCMASGPVCVSPLPDEFYNNGASFHNGFAEGLKSGCSEVAAQNEGR